MAATASSKSAPARISHSKPSSSVLSSTVSPESSPCSFSSPRMSLRSRSKRPGGRRLKTMPDRPAGLSPAEASSPTAAVVIAKSFSSLALGRRVRPKSESRKPTSPKATAPLDLRSLRRCRRGPLELPVLRVALSRQFGFVLLEPGQAVLERGVRRENLGDRAAADRRKEHQGVAGFDRAQIAVRDALHLATDL